MNKQTMLYHGMEGRNTQEQITNTQNNRDEFQEHYAEWKKSYPKDSLRIMYDSIYMNL
jgi:hypothetical protein